jgi:hypothetical protein
MATRGHKRPVETKEQKAAWRLEMAQIVAERERKRIAEKERIERLAKARWEFG